uniref:Deoxyuridine 5'-triphosphate nucleotidohydrolase n=1 Tax=Plectus sambesii TaxID=2011161 RepID=A0A914X3S5_9BILA
MASKKKIYVITEHLLQQYKRRLKLTDNPAINALMNAESEFQSGHLLKLPISQRKEIIADLLYRLRQAQEKYVSVMQDEGYYGALAARSGHANKFGVQIHPGTLDPDFSGFVRCIAFNQGREKFDIKRDEAICQLIVQKVNDVKLVRSEHRFVYDEVHVASKAWDRRRSAFASNSFKREKKANVKMLKRITLTVCHIRFAFISLLVCIASIL